MILTITLHCDGRDSYGCTAAISTGLTSADSLGRLATQSGWHTRPVGTAAGDRVHAYCSSCNERLLTLAAETHGVDESQDSPHVT